MAKFLTEEIADAVCTVIALGFADKYLEKNKAPIVFEYDKTSAQPDYETIAKLFNNPKSYLKKAEGDATKTRVITRKSVSQDKRPFIIGYPDGSKYLSSKQIDEIIKPVMDKYSEVLHRMQESADAMGEDALCGAYIGGAFSREPGVLEPVLVGPSSLELYKPQFRDVSGYEVIIKDSFDKALKHTNNAVAAIVKNRWPEGHDPSYKKNYETGKLFKSCHGMVRAMTLFAGAKDLCFFELALGHSTSKVSSCIPCSIFMTAFGMPASSTHLGRGDNWGFPLEYRDNNKDIVDRYFFQWQTDICQYFDAGIEAFRAGGGLPLHVNAANNMPYYDYKINSEDKPFDVFIKQKCTKEKDDIPAIFLESLTYEKSFIQKIKNTCGIED
jgi:hypothetical protein